MRLNKVLFEQKSRDWGKVLSFTITLLGILHCGQSASTARLHYSNRFSLASPVWQKFASRACAQRNQIMPVALNGRTRSGELPRWVPVPISQERMHNSSEQAERGTVDHNVRDMRLLVSQHSLQRTQGGTLSDSCDNCNVL